MYSLNRKRRVGLEKLLLQVVVLGQAVLIAYFLRSWSDIGVLSDNGNTGLVRGELQYEIIWWFIVARLIVLLFTSRVVIYQLNAGVVNATNVLNLVLFLATVLWGLAFYLPAFLTCNTTWCHNLGNIGGVPQAPNDPNTQQPPNSVFVTFGWVFGILAFTDLINVLLLGRIGDSVRQNDEVSDNLIRDRYATISKTRGFGGLQG